MITAETGGRGRGAWGKATTHVISPQENMESKLSSFSIMETPSPVEVGKGACEVWKTYTEQGNTY